MNRLAAIAGVAFVSAGLIGWAALAWAQPDTEKGTPANEPSLEASGASPATEPAPPGKELPKGPVVPMPGGLQPSASKAAVSPPMLPDMPALPPAKSTPSIVPLGPPPQSGPVPAGPIDPPGTPAKSDTSKPDGTGATEPSKPLPIDPGHLGEGTPPVPGAPAGTQLPPAIAPQPLTPPGSKIAPMPASQPGDMRPALGDGEASGTPARSPLPAEEQLADSATSPDSAVGRQEPAVSLEWVGPTTAKIGQANSYSLMVRNACNIPVQQVLVRVRIPAGVNCSETEPKAVSEGNVLVWELGALQARQEKNLQMKLVPEHKGDISPQAWVTFTGSSVMRIKVREPKLTIKATGPPKVVAGDTATFVLAVSNPGDGAAEQVKIHAALSEGLENARGPKLDYDIGNLAAGETRNVTVQCISKTGGTHTCDATAEADGGLHAKDTVSVSVTTPRLDLQMVGPGLRYLGRKALYSIKVTNPGDAPASNVTVSDVVPEGFKVLAASDGGRHDFSTRTVSWFLGEVAPGATHEIKLEVQAVNQGEFKHKASAVGARGLSAEAELGTRVEGLSALLLEMVDTEDPIEVSSETSYEVRITNTGSKVETDIKLVASIPDKMQFKNATGPVRFHEDGKTIVFEPIEKLAPKADAIFRINVKAVEAGTVRFKIQMTSTNLTEPVIKMEATRIYSDAPEVKSSH
ncbi:MAG TPA: CARDB domain-containing protein [Gemmataceae bacterium]|jgi:uncharacterized repeat protein (TIGR01451 family)